MGEAPAPGPPRPVRGIVVAVPAHDEAARLPAALAGIRRAAGHPGLGGVPVLVVVAADDCRDATARAARAAGAEVVTLAARNAGAARAAAVLHGVRRRGLPVGQVWVATTDADSEPPREWLAHQLRCAGRGWGAVVGTVTVGRWPSGYPAAAISRYAAGYARGLHSRDGHAHVHGANLGVHAADYFRAGGFPALATGEDRALVAALEEAGTPILRSAAHPVTTSARLSARSPRGFAAHLRALRAPDGVAGGVEKAARYQV